MFRVLKADKDTYITNKYVDGIQAKSGNVGTAGTMDLFKLYGITTINNIAQIELSRILIHFDLNPLRDLVNNGKVDISHPSFKCQLSLRDVYGGQTTPNNFTVDIFPLSASFDEGSGKDTAYYVDEDVTNFFSASREAAWLQEGCSAARFSTSPGDYITSSITINNTKASQTFITGEEDLLIDVTNIVSATLKKDLPDSGYRISFSDTIESDTYTYFVKRFASRTAYDETKRPQLQVKFDDSIFDETSNLRIDSPYPASSFLYNYVHGQLTNLVSASSPITGSNCILLELKTEASGVGSYSLFFTGSQHYSGINPATGIYSASISLPLTNPKIKASYLQTGSINFVPVWSSIDRTIAYVTGSKITAYAPVRIDRRLNPRRYTVGVLGISTDYAEAEEVTLRVNIFDQNSPIIKAVRLPHELPGLALKNSYYAIRNSVTNEYVIPFDSETNSTKLSSDSSGMYFNFNTSTLTSQRSYVVDIMTIVDGQQQKYLNASPVFRVIKI
jgi:hypothetical protein